MSNNLYNVFPTQAPIDSQASSHLRYYAGDNGSSTVRTKEGLFRRYKNLVDDASG